MSLLSNARFQPLFVTQFLGAFNDNLFKNALLVYLFFFATTDFGIDRDILMPLGAGLFILPFLLFSATAGQLADKYPMHQMIRTVKLLEIAIMALGSLALWIESLFLMLGSLFLMGAQSTFFGPLKYASLPRLVNPQRLVSANAWFEAATFLAILLGTLAGSLIVGLPSGVLWVCVSLLLLSIVGAIFSFRVPAMSAASPDLKVNYNPLTESLSLINRARAHPDIFRVILGISWFWFLGATYLSQFPTFAAEVIQEEEQAVALLLALFSIGIGLGSYLCNRWMAGQISALYVPLAALVMALSSIDLYFAANALQEQEKAGLGPLLTTWPGLRVLLDLLLVSMAGGVFIVPLYTLLQSRSDDAVRARMIAVNNIMNAGFMVVSSLIVMLMLSLGMTLNEVFLFLGLSAFAVAILVCTLLPKEFFSSILQLLLKSLFRVEIEGKENWPSPGEPAVIVANHISFLDGPLIAAYRPDAIFPINTHIFARWWANLSKYFATMLPIDPGNPYVAKTLIQKVSEGNSLVIFPEGRITVTGALMKVYPGPAMVADRAGAKIVPVRIEGAQFSKFSRMGGTHRTRWFPKITLRVMDPIRLELPAQLRGKARRELASKKLYDIMSEMLYLTSVHHQNTLYEALMDAKSTFGPSTPVVEDHRTISRPINYGTLVKGAKVLGRKVAQFTEKDEIVGVMLPNAVGSVVTFFALQAYHRVPAMLNFSTGPETLRIACETAQVKTVLSSREFIRLAKLESVVEALEAQVRFVYLDDIRAELTLGDKLKGVLHRYRPEPDRRDKPAVVLFTSGSEGTPKGVVLSHANLLSNIAQVASRIDFSPRDIFFNALPIFHSFGMTGGMLLPVLSGLKTFMYPSPLHYRIIPELVYDINATVLFGTDTFLANYARRADPYDFYSIRYLVAGAEKVKPETRELYMNKFGKTILEGYGATECSPVLAVNTPMHFKAGSVGRLMPMLEARLEKVEGVQDAGRLWVRGPNVMLGYLRHSAPGELEAPPEGWYDTGDIVHIDPDGFVSIEGRAKRFIKIAGEMISLTAVELMLSQISPDAAHAVAGRPDPKKGEQLVLLTEDADLDRGRILSAIKSQGLSELSCPRVIRYQPRLPLLGTGKVDYTEVQRLALRDDS